MGREEEPAAPAAPAKRDGLAVAAAVLGALGMVFALLFPARFQLPFVLGFYLNVYLIIFLGIAAEPAELTAILLAAFGFPPLAMAAASLARIKRSRGELSGKAWASAGVACGAILTLFAALLLTEPVATRFEIKHALAQLDSVRGQEKDWNYGNVIHEANTRLGRISLKQGEVGDAKRYLLEAGKTPGSPQLDSFGPDLTLAKELLQKGEKETVIEYLQLCAKFWESRRAHLKWWISMLQAGQIPDFKRSVPPPEFEKSAQPPERWTLRIVEASRTEELEAYGPEGAAPRRAEPGRMWLVLLIESEEPSARTSLKFGEMVVVDEAGASHPAVAIAGPPPDGLRPKFLFLEEAFRPWRDDSGPLSASSWAYSYDAGGRSEISFSDSNRRTIFAVARTGLVKFLSREPARLLLLFAPLADATQFQLRFGEHARAAVRGISAASFKEDWEAWIASLAQKCEAGDIKVCRRLGVYYKVGWKVPKDPVGAAALHQKACDGGDRDSCSELGFMYERGAGVPKDPARAVAPLNQACEAGEKTDCTKLGYLYQQGEAVPKDEARAAALYRKACEGGDASGCAYLGWMHFNGTGVPKDEARAVPLFKRGCDAGNAWACTVLGLAYFRGTGIPRDPPRAAALYKQGCDGGIADACGNLGTMHRYGQGIPKDEAGAVALFEKGCRGGYAIACQELKQARR